jgi:hypothetical protein
LFVRIRSASPVRDGVNRREQDARREQTEITDCGAVGEDRGGVGCERSLGEGLRRAASFECALAGLLWKWQLAKRSAAPAAPEVPPCDFVEVRAAGTPGDSTYEIVFRTGHRLRVPRRFESDDLKRLIGILGEPQ